MTYEMCLVLLPNRRTLKSVPMLLVLEGGHPFSGNGNAVSWPGSRLPNDVLTEDFSFVLELGWFILKSRIARWITEFQSFPDDGTGSVTTVKAVACALIRQEVTMLRK